MEVTYMPFVGRAFCLAKGSGALSQARIDRTMTRAVGLLAVTVVFEKTNLTRT